jgi:hypothetical protein
MNAAVCCGSPTTSPIELKGFRSGPFPVLGTAVVTRYLIVRALALRLLDGEVIEHVDKQGRRWRATATALTLVAPETGEDTLVVEGDAYEIAERLRKLV